MPQVKPVTDETWTTARDGAERKFCRTSRSWPVLDSMFTYR
jgi:hypothetical protein